MSSATLMASAAFLWVIAVLFVYVGRLVLIRLRPRGESHAATFFATWWYALAALAGVQGVPEALASLGVRWLPAYVLLLHLSNLIQVVALWALLYYVLFVYTGKRAFFWPLTAFYGIVAVGIVYFIESHIASGAVVVRVQDWDAGADAPTATADPLLQLLLAALILPQLVALVLYAFLAVRAPDREQRFRVITISGSLFVWLAASYWASASGATGSVMWSVLARLLAVLAAGAVVEAFRPPVWLDEWLHAPSLTMAIHRGLQERIRQLV